MASFDFVVDTGPMANSMNGVAQGVGVVGGAVTAMQAAVIATEKETSEKICKSIDGGFYMVMRSRFSQRLAQFQSIMSSRVGSMMETGSAIDRTHQQMIGDFNRIKARYSTLFRRLDANLEERIRELDRDAMVISKKRDALIADGQCRDAPKALIHASDINNVTLKASNARLKARALGSIDSLRKGAEGVIQYEHETGSVLEPGPAKNPSIAYYPVVYSVGESLITPGEFFFDVKTPAAMGSTSTASVAQAIRRSGGNMAGTSGKDLDAVRMSFFEKISSKGVDERVSAVMRSLFDASFPSPAYPQNPYGPALSSGNGVAPNGNPSGMGGGVS